MNGRTYCGFYRGYYLKSTLEFIYAKYLDHMGIPWEYEIQIFSLSNGGSYKPDFKLSDSSFVEVKGTFNYQTDLPRIKLFEQDYGVKVTILQDNDLRKLIRTTPFVYEHLRQEWKLQSMGLGMDTSGSNNPRYGATLSQETKDKIAKKAKLRFQNPEYKEQWSLGRRNSLRVQKQTANLQQFNDLKKKPLVTLVCEICEKDFLTKNWSKETRRFCSRRCGVIAQRGNGIKFSSQIKSLAIQYAKENQQSIMNCKLNKVNSVLSGFYLKVEEAFGVKDIRTLTEAVLGHKGGRKDLLMYFRTLVENVLRTEVN